MCRSRFPTPAKRCPKRGHDSIVHGQLLHSEHSAFRFRWARSFPLAVGTVGGTTTILALNFPLPVGADVRAAALSATGFQLAVGANTRAAAILAPSFPLAMSTEARATDPTRILPLPVGTDGATATIAAMSFPLAVWATLFHFPWRLSRGAAGIWVSLHSSGSSGGATSTRRPVLLYFGVHTLPRLG